MPNRISEKLWPVDYWHNKKKQFAAGTIGGRRLLHAFGLSGLVVIFAITVIAGILTARPHDPARQIPLGPLTQDRMLSSVPPVQSEEAVHQAAAPLEKARPAASPAVWPTAGQVVYSFGWQEHPVLKDWRYHNGVSLAAEEGQAVLAALGGEVVGLQEDQESGVTVIVASGPWTVYHGSLAAAVVKTGDSVLAGQLLGRAGTSFHEPYPHVFIRIEKSGQAIDPHTVLPDL